MSQWRIEPEDVQTVLTSVDQDRNDLTNALSSDRLSEIVAGLTWGGEWTIAVNNAVLLLYADQQENLSSIGNRIAAGIAGVGNATLAYQRGQEEMLGRFQPEMQNSADEGDFSFYEEHGYVG